MELRISFDTETLKYIVSVESFTVKGEGGSLAHAIKDLGEKMEIHQRTLVK